MLYVCGSDISNGRIQIIIPAYGDRSRYLILCCLIQILIDFHHFFGIKSYVTLTQQTSLRCLDGFGKGTDFFFLHAVFMQGLAGDHAGKQLLQAGIEIFLRAAEGVRCDLLQLCQYAAGSRFGIGTEDSDKKLIIGFSMGVG